MTRIALVTGGTRGIGAAVSLALKAQGRRVVANYASNDEAAEAFKAEHGISVAKFSVASFEECDAGIAKIVAEHGKIEVLVNNAGVTRDGTLTKMRRDI
jgi:acetoacetyl-CoA reductase